MKWPLHRMFHTWLAMQAFFASSWCFTDPDGGPFATSQGNGERFKIEGRAIVPNAKTQDWVSSSRVLVEGEEFVGFLRYVLNCH